MRIRSISIPLVSVLLLFPFLAQAKPGKDVKEREKAARKACMVGNYQEGVGILADLFIEVGDFNYIFNQARCLQQNHRWEEALDSFREYLRKATLSKGHDRSEIEEYMQECQEHLATPALAPAPEPVTVPPPAPPPQPVAPVAAVAVEPVVPVAVPEPADENRGAGLRTAGIITGAVGLLGLGAGVFCSVRTYSVRDKPSTLDSYKTAGNISYIAGGVALVTGVTLYIVGATRRGRSASEGTAVSLVPVVGHSQGAVVLLGSF